MLQQTLLSQLASFYDFKKANQIAALSQTKPFIRAWMALDLSQPIAQSVGANSMDFAAQYQQDGDYLKYNAKSNLAEHCDKRFASKADLKLITVQKNIWIEFHMLHENDLSIKKECDKLYADAKRVSALRQTLSQDDVLLLVGLWGSFNNADMHHFQPLDNNSQCAYVIDSSLSGSTQIARLSQMKKTSDKRFLLAAF
ncbi:hypothetical protein MSP8887_01424 [Marinomonas spartinae]|uniref:hypothetical protein n=1 Tax=Marinomonas spartinae TaxID=1792290 RepID=UPI000808E67D|nr:hypothetical protein [Marinomonas spartinae]SBS31069.1 hypothetical protein MSP8887_01424 [Marinomonas spartinae]